MMSNFEVLRFSVVKRDIAFGEAYGELVRHTVFRIHRLPGCGVDS